MCGQKVWWILTTSELSHTNSKKGTRSITKKGESSSRGIDFIGLRDSAMPQYAFHWGAEKRHTDGLR